MKWKYKKPKTRFYFSRSKRRYIQGMQKYEKNKVKVHNRLIREHEKEQKKIDRRVRFHRFISIFYRKNY